MPLEISEVSSDKVPPALLLLADPSEKKVEGYLAASRCFAANLDGQVAGACVVRQVAADVYELMNIAVLPGLQRKGIGTRLLRQVVAEFEKSGARRLEVGTGSFGYQLAFYQRLGFRVSSIERDFFVRNYEAPIFEEGIQLRDMLRLVLEFA